MQRVSPEVGGRSPKRANDTLPSVAATSCEWDSLPGTPIAMFSFVIPHYSDWTNLRKLLDAISAEWTMRLHLRTGLSTG
jgi:hypothetical protein